MEKLIRLLLILLILGFFGVLYLYKTSPNLVPLVWRIPYTLEDCGYDATNSEAMTNLDKVVIGLNKIRVQTHKRYKILSGYRDKVKNKKVEGSKNSQHLLGKAIDIKVPMNDRYEFYEAAKSAGFVGYGWGNNSVHIDMGSKRWWTYDNSGKEAKGRNCDFIYKAPENFKKDYKACK